MRTVEQGANRTLTFSFLTEVVTRMKSSPVLAKTVATAPVNSVKRSATVKSMLRVVPFNFSVGAGLPLTSVIAASSSNWPFRLA